MKRKRSGENDKVPGNKRARKGEHQRHKVSSECPVLPLYYSHVLTLREYLLSRLSKASKARRRLLAHYGDSEDSVEIRKLLDETIVGTFNAKSDAHEQQLQASQEQELSIFSQQISESTARSSPGSARSQSEVGTVLNLS